MHSPRRGTTFAGTPGEEAFPTPSPNFRFSGFLSKLGEGRVAWKVRSGSLVEAGCAVSPLTLFSCVFRRALCTLVSLSTCARGGAN